MAVSSSPDFFATLGLGEIAQGLNVVKVSVLPVRVEHEGRLMDFTK